MSRKARWYHVGIIAGLVPLAIMFSGCSKTMAGASSRENPPKVRRVKETIPKYRIDKFGDYPDEITFSAYMRYNRGQFDKSAIERTLELLARTNDVIEVPFNALLSDFGTFHDGDKYSKAFFDIMPGGRGFDRTIFRYDTDRYHD